MIDRGKLNKKLAINLLNEISILKEIDHQNIIELYAVHQSENCIYLVTEYCIGGDLCSAIDANRFGGIAEPLVQRVIAQIAEAIKELRRHNIFHRDIKPQNIFLQRSANLGKACIKLADFGFARFIKAPEGDLAATFCGSPLYMVALSFTI